MYRHHPATVPILQTGLADLAVAQSVFIVTAAIAR
jgi:hypothetical protein